MDVSYLGEKNDTYQICFEIKDTGSGIAADKLEKIFSKYEQENELISKQYGGTGLGLNISQLFVEKMGGQIKVDSELGKGSKFTFDVLLKKPEMKKRKLHSFHLKKTIFIDLCSQLLDVGHELNILSDENHIVKGIQNKVIDCVLINSLEKQSAIDHILQYKDANGHVFF